MKSIGMRSAIPNHREPREDLVTPGSPNPLCHPLLSAGIESRVYRVESRLKSLFSKPISVHRRANLGACLVYRMALGWGNSTAGWRLDLVALLGEVYGQFNSGAVEVEDVQVSWTSLQMARRLGYSGSFGVEEDREARAFLEGVIGRDGLLGDRSVPEMVLFLRGLVFGCDGAVGFEPVVRASLLEAMTWLGLAMELGDGEVSQSSWNGAFQSLALPISPLLNLEQTRHQAAKQFEKLGGQEGYVLRLFALRFCGAMGSRRFRLWEPQKMPLADLCDGKAFAIPKYEAQTEHWIQIVKNHLGQLLASKGSSFREAGVYQLQQGGKRIRPMVVMGAAWSCGVQPEAAGQEAALIELLHQSSLVLDDILDDSAIRRRCKTMHTATSVPFALGFTGWMLGRLFVAPAGLDPAVRACLVDCGKALVEGQRSEWTQTGRFDLSVSDYYRVIHLKTGQLFASAAELGGVVADASVSQRRHLREFGKELGLLFQIVDDLLDYTGQTSVFGKEVGLDLRTRKVTLPIIHLWQKLTTEERLRLAEGEPQLSLLPWVQMRMGELGIFEACRRRAHIHGQRARRHIQSLEAGGGVNFLVALVDEMEARVR